ASTGIDQSSHVTRQKIAGFLIHTRDEAQRVFRSCAGKPPSERNRCSHPSAVIICARRTKDGVVVRADDDDLRATPRDFCFDIVSLLSLHLIAVSSGPQRRPRVSTCDEI